MVIFGAVFIMIAMVITKTKGNGNKRFSGLEDSGLKKGTRRQAVGIIIAKTWLWGRLVFAPIDKLNYNILVIGGTRSGKTSGFLIPSARSIICSKAVNSTSLYVVDISGDISKNVIPKGCTETVALIDLKGDNSAIAYDVLAPIDNAEDENERYELLEKLAFELIPTKAISDSTAEYYLVCSQKLLTGIVTAKYHEGLDIVKIAEYIVNTGSEQVVKDVIKSGNKRAISYVSGFDGMNEQTLVSIHEAVQSSVSLIANNTKIQAVLKRGGFAPSDIEHKSLFVNIPDAKLENYTILLSLISNQIINYVMSRDIHKRSKKVIFFLDEYTSLKIPIVYPARKIIKQLGILCVMTQSVSDLILATSKEETQVIFDNFSVQLCYGASSLQTQTHFSDYAGRYNVVKKSKSMNMLNKNETGKETHNETERLELRMLPEDFGKLKKNMIAFHPNGVSKFRKNQYFTLGNRLYYRKQKRKALRIDKRAKRKSVKNITLTYQKVPPENLQSFSLESLRGRERMSRENAETQARKMARKHAHVLYGLDIRIENGKYETIFFAPIPFSRSDRLDVIHEVTKTKTTTHRWAFHAPPYID